MDWDHRVVMLGLAFSLLLGHASAASLDLPALLLAPDDACRTQIRQVLATLAATSDRFVPDYANLEKSSELRLEKRAPRDLNGRLRDGRTREMPIRLQLQMDQAGACWLVRDAGKGEAMREEVARKVLLDQCSCQALKQ